jgi:hypothetical protein
MILRALLPHGATIFFGREFRFPIRKCSARERARKTYDASIAVIAEQICCVAAKMWRAELPLFLMKQAFFTID